MLHATLILRPRLVGHHQAMPTRITIALSLLLSIPTNGTAQEYRARLHDGTIKSGQLRGGSARTMAFVTQQKTVGLDAIQRLRFPSSSSIPIVSRPDRVFHLRGGGKVTGKLSKLTDETITLILRQIPVTFPHRMVLAIDQIVGERQLLYEDFNADRLTAQWKSKGQLKPTQLGTRTALLIAPGESCQLQLPSPIRAGQCQVAFFNPGSNRETPFSGWELQFGSGKARQSLTVRLSSSDGVFTISHSPHWRLTTQRVRQTSGWNSATIHFDENRIQVLIGSQLLAYGPPPPGALRSMRLFSEAATTDSAAEGKPSLVWFDDLQITERIANDERPDSFVLDSQSQFVLESGDVIFGELIEVDSHRIQLKGPFGEVTLPWRKVRRVVLAEQEFPAHPVTTETPPTGWQAKIKFQRNVNHPAQPGDELLATILSIQDGQITLIHPLLGTWSLPVAHVGWIEPDFLGTRLVLASDTAHLGNQVRPKFRHKEPLGSSWHGEFELESAPEGAAFVRVHVSDLEPAGKGTPPGSRYLSELRNGFLGTSVVLNGESLGRLNDYISQPKTLRGRQAVRLRVPSRLLRKGKNTWRIEQTSRRDDPQEFDDCEIGPVWLEIETE